MSGDKDQREATYFRMYAKSLNRVPIACYDESEALNFLNCRHKCCHMITSELTLSTRSPRITITEATFDGTDTAATCKSYS